MVSVLYEQLLSLDAELPDGAQMFALRFEVVEGWRGKAEVVFSDDPTPRKLASFQSAPPELQTRDGWVEIELDPNVNQPPLIELIGSSEIIHEAGWPYEDAGARATDVEDGVLTIEVQGEVDGYELGVYGVSYRAVDSGARLKYLERCGLWTVCAGADTVGRK